MLTKHVKNFDVPMEEGRLVYVIVDNDIRTIKQILDLYQIKIINPTKENIIIEKYNGKYYDVDTREQINLQKYLEKTSYDNIKIIILILQTLQPDTLITKLISEFKVKPIFNDFDNDLIKIDYYEILNVLLTHDLIGGRVGSFMGQYDNKMLYYVKDYDLKKNHCYGAKLDEVFIRENYSDLCDHIINLYLTHKNKPVPEKTFTESKTNLNYIQIMNYFGDTSKFI